MIQVEHVDRKARTRARPWLTSAAAVFALGGAACSCDSENKRGAGDGSPATNAKPVMDDTEVAAAHEAAWQEARPAAIALVHLVHGPRSPVGVDAPAAMNVAVAEFMRRGRGVNVEVLPPLQRTEYRAVTFALTLAESVDSGRSRIGYDVGAFPRRLGQVLRDLQVQAITGTKPNQDDVGYFQTLGDLAQALHGASPQAEQAARAKTKRLCDELSVTSPDAQEHRKALLGSCARWHAHMQDFELSASVDPASPVADGDWDERARTRRLGAAKTLPPHPSAGARATIMRTRWGWTGSERALAVRGIAALKRLAADSSATPPAAEVASAAAEVDVAACEKELAVLEQRLPALGLAPPTCEAIVGVLGKGPLTTAEFRSWLIDRTVTGPMVVASRQAAGELLGALRSPSRAAEAWIGTVFAQEFGWTDAARLRRASMSHSLCSGLSLLELPNAGIEAKQLCLAYPNAANDAYADPVSALDGMEFALIPNSERHNQWMLRWPHAPLGWLLSEDAFEGSLAPTRPVTTAVERRFDEDKKPGATAP